MSHMRNGIAPALLLLTVAACGDVWGFDDLTDTGGDDGGNDARTTPDGSVPDGSGLVGGESGVADAAGDAHDDASVETGPVESGPVEAAPPPETGPVCTTTGGTLGPAASPCLYNGSGYQWPAYFVSDYPGSDICEPQNTPSACSCVETYNCACLLANVGCDPGFTKTCQAGSNGVTVICS